jgi:thiamine pyrophosphate-dependent acetolactate synthase large subunit-like protein
MQQKTDGAEAASAPGLDEPTCQPIGKFYGSDALAAALRELQVPYLSLNPGASFRGLHDSLVNFLGNRRPQMILSLHEETAVAIAHGYAKSSGQMMGVILHSNVGMMHGSMNIFNAWCDRTPMLVLGATGPLDAAKRRPWIDWIHTSGDQGALIRDFIKWDDQPASIAAAQESLFRASQIARTAPFGPVYVNLDAGLQEQEIPALPPTPSHLRYQPPPDVHPDPQWVAKAAQLLSKARAPVILIGRVGRGEQAWNDRVALAEKLAAPVLIDLKTPAAFPTNHSALAAPPAFFLGREAAQLVRSADVILSLDWIDLGGTLRQVFDDQECSATVIQVSLDQHSHRGWGKEYFGLAPTDCYLLCDPDTAVPLLTAACTSRGTALPAFAPMSNAKGAPLAAQGVPDMQGLAAALNEALGDAPICLARLPLGWNGGYRHFLHPLDYLGYDGGGGIGSGPGMSIGTALALKDTGRLTVAVLGDGDFMMGNSALWTAVHYRIPLLIVVANNRSFYNDELHQERVAMHRNRPVENKWIGQAIADPDIDIAQIATAQGATGIGPITNAKALRDAIVKGLEVVRAGGVAVIDARVQAGYGASMSGAPAAQLRK